MHLMLKKNIKLSTIIQWKLSQQVKHHISLSKSSHKLNKSYQQSKVMRHVSRTAFTKQNFQIGRMDRMMYFMRNNLNILFILYHLREILIIRIISQMTRLKN